MRACPRFAGRKLPLNDEVYASAPPIPTFPQPEHRAVPAQSYGRIYCDPAMEATDLYTRQCSLECQRPRTLAVMGATLADGGVNPLTRAARGRRDGLPLRACRDDRPPDCTRHQATGSTTSACREERDRRRHRHRLSLERADWALSRRRWTPPATASRDSSPRSSCHSGWAWICSSRSLTVETRNGVREDIDIRNTNIAGEDAMTQTRTCLGAHPHPKRRNHGCR